MCPTWFEWFAGMRSDAPSPCVSQSNVRGLQGMGADCSFAMPICHVPTPENDTLNIDIVDFSPEWDWECGGSKALVMFESSLPHEVLSNAILTCHFGERLVRNARCSRESTSVANTDTRGGWVQCTRCVYRRVRLSALTIRRLGNENWSSELTHCCRWRTSYIDRQW